MFNSVFLRNFSDRHRYNLITERVRLSELGSSKGYLSILSFVTLGSVNIFMPSAYLLALKRRRSSTIGI